MILRLGFFLIFGFFQFASAASEINSQTIKFVDLATLVKEKNGHLKAEQMNISANESRTGHWARSFFPQISGAFGSEELKTGAQSSKGQEYWSIGASVNLFNGGRDRLEERLRSMELEYSKGEYNLSYIFNLREAQIAFWEISASQKLIDLRQEELKKNQEYLNSAKRRVGAGLTTKADVVQFELHKSKLEQEIEQIHLRVDEAKSRLGAILSINDAHGIELNDELPRSIALEVAPMQPQDQIEIKQNQKAQSIEMLRSQSEGRWWLPQLDLYASHGIPALSHEEDRALLNEKETLTGVRLTLDLGKGWGSQAEKKARDFKAKSLGYKVEQKMLELRLLDQELRHDFAVSSKLFDDNEKIILKSSEFLKLTEVEYARGLRNGPDLLGAVRQYYEALEKSVGLRFSLLKTKASLQSLVSKDTQL